MAHGTRQKQPRLVVSGLKTDDDIFFLFGLKTGGRAFFSLDIKTGSYSLVIWVSKLPR
jgi:hypothetical protein